MHELLLHASLPAARHPQVLSILSGLTATPAPGHVHERVYLFRPRDSGSATTTTPSFGASQTVDTGKVRRQINGSGGDTRWVRVVQDLPPNAVAGEDSNGDAEDGMEGIETNGLNGHMNGGHYDAEAVDDESTWMLHLDEMPEAGVRSHIARKITIREMRGREDVQSWALQNDMHFTTQYLLVGRYFVQGHVLIKVFRVLQLLPQEHATHGDGFEAQLSAFERRPLDGNGAWIVEACVKVEDGTDTGLMAKATDELNRVAEQLEGIVDLRAVERLSLDTRAR